MAKGDAKRKRDCWTRSGKTDPKVLLFELDALSVRRWPGVAAVIKRVGKALLREAR